MMQSEQTRIDIIRHGEHALGDAICGVTDPELTALGIQQMQSTMDRLSQSGLCWDRCLTSPRIRCSQFAKQISSALALDCQSFDGLAEVDFGVWEALTYVEINKRFPGQWQKWIYEPDSVPEHGGESYSRFLARVDQSFKAFIRDYRGESLLCFSHGGVIRALLYAVLKLERKSMAGLSVPHACHSSIIVYHQDGKEDWFQMNSHNTFAAVS